MQDGRGTETVKKTAVVDIDDVLAGYVTGCIDRYGYPVVWSWKLQEMWPLVDWTKHFEPKEHVAFTLGLRPIANAKDGVEQLRSSGYEPRYLTASSDDSWNSRSLWLKIHDFPDLPVICTDGFNNKVAWIYTHKPDVVIDDLPMTLEAAYNSGAYTVVFDTPWNREIRFGRRVRNWKEAERLFQIPRTP